MRGTLENHKPNARNLRKGRFSEPGRIYLVTAVTKDRERCFADLNAARCLVRTLKKESDLHRADTLAFVIMPDHFHWLMQLGELADLSAVVRSVKAVSDHRLGFPVWQEGFYDRALRRDEDIKETARYVVANPLRAGLVSRLGDYPHWDAMWL